MIAVDGTVGIRNWMLWMERRELDAVDGAVGIRNWMLWMERWELDALDDKLTVDRRAVVISWFSTPCRA